MKIFFALAASAIMLASTASAADDNLVHCFLFTAVDKAPDADWQAFFKATDALPSKIPAVKHVWYSKLGRPMEIGGATRQWGVCLHLGGPDARKAYAAAPYHSEWEAAYFKVRVPGTSTFDLQGH